MRRWPSSRRRGYRSVELYRPAGIPAHPEDDRRRRQRRSRARQAASDLAAAESACNEAQGPVELAPISNVPITLKLTEDTKVIYETVGQTGGNQCAVRPRLHLAPHQDRVEWGDACEEALEIIALESKTFWRPVTPEYDFRGAGQSGKAQRAGTERHQDLLSRQSVAAHRIAGRGQRDAQILEVRRIQPLPSQGAHCGARNAGSDGAGRKS